MLYWTWNNILTFSQQALIMKRQGADVDISENLGIKRLTERLKGAPPRPKDNNGRSRTPAE